jgi:flagellar hook-basal body complex protein FliE
MSIPPISGAPFTMPTAPTTPTATDAAGGSGSGFGNALVEALDGVAQAQDNADQVASLAATGDLTNVHDLTIATTEAELATSLTTAVRDKAVAAFNAIMSMPV